MGWNLHGVNPTGEKNLPSPNRFVSTWLSHFDAAKTVGFGWKSSPRFSLTRMPFFHRKWWMRRKPGGFFVWGDGWGWVFFLLGLLGVDHLWHDMTYICKDLPRSSSFFFRRKFLWQVFRWGAHFFWIFEYTFFFVQVVFWNVVHFVSTLVIWWGRLYRCFGLLNSLRSFVGGFLGWCPAPPFYPGGICGRPCKQFGDLTAFLETFLLGF